MTILVFAVAVGFLMQISLGKELLILGSILSILGLTFYVGFKSSEGYSKRATFLFVGASIIGFSIWAVMVLSFNDNRGSIANFDLSWHRLIYYNKPDNLLGFRSINW